MKKSKVILSLSFLSLALVAAFVFTNATTVIPPDNDTSFIVVGDLHTDTPLNGVSEIADWNRRQVEVMNKFKTDSALITKLRNLGINPDFRGIIVSGDVTDDGIESQWNDFEKIYGGPSVTSPLNKWRVFETGGNHEYPWRSTADQFTQPTQVYSLTRIAARNNWRQTQSNNLVLKTDAGHYAMKFSNNVLVIHLGAKISNFNGEIITKGSLTDANDPLRYRNVHPFHSLKFLHDVLASEFVDANTKVILDSHYPITSNDRYTYAEKYDLFQILKNANLAGRGKVVAMLSAHRHRTSQTNWCGLPVFESGTPLQFDGNLNLDAAFSVLSINNEYLHIRSVSWDLQGRINLDRDMSKCNFNPTSNDKCFDYDEQISNINLNMNCYAP